MATFDTKCSSSARPHRAHSGQHSRHARHPHDDRRARRHYRERAARDIDRRRVPANDAINRPHRHRSRQHRATLRFALLLALGQVFCQGRRTRWQFSTKVTHLSERSDFVQAALASPDGMVDEVRAQYDSALIARASEQRRLTAVTTLAHALVTAAESKKGLRMRKPLIVWLRGPANEPICARSGSPRLAPCAPSFRG